MPSDHAPPHLPALFGQLWRSYLPLCPSAPAVKALLGGDVVRNDHVAFRTFAHPRLGIAQLAAPFVAAGYVAGGHYRFEAKKLHATHFERGPGDPKIFVSELVLEACSPALRGRVGALVESVPEAAYDVPLACDLGRVWDVSYTEYEALREESEYAAWVAAHGLRVNHFTASVDALPGQPSLAEVVERLAREGVALSHAGGVIKGSARVGLTQASTQADRIPVDFRDGRAEISGAYYELAERHALPDGTRFEGFVTQSADRIFESTDVG